jgi:hypothetical protein
MPIMICPGRAASARRQQYHAGVIAQVARVVLIGAGAGHDEVDVQRFQGVVDGLDGEMNVGEGDAFARALMAQSSTTPIAVAVFERNPLGPGAIVTRMWRNESMWGYRLGH